jgi:hypothetical protein
MTVICINSKGRPNEVPLNKWLIQFQEYTVIEAVKCTVQGGLLGYKLDEIDLSGCFPYLYFAANRFAPVEETPQLEEEHQLELIV